MVDWNGDGNVDPTEVVLTNIIFDENEEPEERLVQEDITSCVNGLIQESRKINLRRLRDH